MSSKILVRKYMTLSEFVAYLTNGRLPADTLFERQFDSVHPFTKDEAAAAELRAKCVLELGLVRATGYRYTRVSWLSLPFACVCAGLSFLIARCFRGKIYSAVEARPLSKTALAFCLMSSPLSLDMARPYYRIKRYRLLKRKYCDVKVH